MKATFLLCLWTVIFFKLSAQVAGPQNPNSFSNADLPGYIQQWIDITNVGLEDENYATFGNLDGPKGSHTDYLLVTNFGFQIPAGAIIKGIKVEVDCGDANTHTSDYSVRIVNKGNITGEEKAQGTPYPSTVKHILYGGPLDLWGESWDYSTINDNEFGVAIAAQRNSDEDSVQTDGRVNNIQITVYYGFSTLPVTLTSFTATLQNKSVLLNWRTSSENNIDNYNAERSADGRNFNSITSVPGLNTPAADYSYVDNFPLPGISYYRLNIQGASGYQKYSQVVSVKNNKANLVSLFPSPWQKGEDLNINNDKKEKLSIYFFNAGGQVISTVTTDTKLVPTETLANKTGLMYYKITDDKNNVLGTGQLKVL